MSWLILGTVLLIVAAGILVFFGKGGFRFPWVQFYVKGKESGFSMKEIRLLRRVAQQNRMRNPAALFWSEKALDRCIRGTILRFRSTGSEDIKENRDFLQQLFGFRKRVEFNLPKYRLGITTTRSINAGQPLKLTFPGAGAYTSTVVENMRRYMAITHPKGKRLPPSFSWQGQVLKVYFWRPEDAGYYFETKVIGDFMDRKFPILHIAHSDSLERAQKRGSVRRDVKNPARLLPLRDVQDANENWETVGGYRGRTMDVSEDGMAVMVGGKVRAGIAVKVQLELGGEKVVMCGVVRGVTYKQKNNVSILHIQAASMSVRQRNAILTFVYGIFED